MPKRFRCPHCKFTSNVPTTGTLEYHGFFAKCTNPMCGNIVDMRDNYVGDDEV